MVKVGQIWIPNRQINAEGIRIISVDRSMAWRFRYQWVDTAHYDNELRWVTYNLPEEGWVLDETSEVKHIMDQYEV